MGNLQQFQPFKGQQLIDCADTINTVATAHRYSVNVLDPTFPKNIDFNAHRLNIHVNDEQVIQKFSVG